MPITPKTGSLFHADSHYRNIIDSNEVAIDQSTCLVGKNEAGKTAFLKALEGLRSTDPTYKAFGKIESYPRRYLAEYGERHPDGEATVITSTWKMDNDDVSAVEAELGEKSVSGRKVCIRKNYEETTATWTVPIDSAQVLANLTKRFGLNKAEREAIGNARSGGAAAKALESVSGRTERQNELLAALKKFRDSDDRLHTIDILEKRTPRFLYFSHYDRMSGQISINKLNEDKKARATDVADRVFLDFLEYAGTTLEELGKHRRNSLAAVCMG